VGRLPFNVLGMIAEFEADLILMHTREGMAVPRRTPGQSHSSAPEGLA
jgi:DNA invertase Pin-like site-specific DNA recombinase